MKKYNILFFFLLLLVLASDTVPVAGQTSAGRWKLIFSDEFNLPDGSQPDTAKWSRPPRGEAIWSRWLSDSADVVYIKGGCLVCRAVPQRVVGDTAAMRTGAVHTKGRFAFRYGRVEVRMKTNLMQGNFPAAWMRPADGDPALYSEIDIMESYGARACSFHTAHTELTRSDRRHGEANSFRRHVDITQWHVYGIEWTEKYIVWTVDGETVGVYRKSTDARLLAKGQWTFDRSFFLLLNQSVGNGAYGTSPDVNVVYETYIDWVRVYADSVRTDS
jgi:beta-glucanase (GH16 family)